MLTVRPCDGERARLTDPPYATAYIGHDGTCDFNIMIRTVDHVPGGDRYWSGAGITLLSDTHAEWEEVQLKAERIIDPPVSGMIEI